MLPAVESPDALSIRRAGVSLPLTTPGIDTYPRHAYLLAALEGRPECQAWIMSNFVQICATPIPDRKDIGGTIDWFFDFYSPDLERSYVPFLATVQRVHRDLLVSLRLDPPAVFREALCSGYYLMVPVDEYHLPPSSAYRKYRHPHFILIHGFDDDAQTFDIAGYFGRRFARQTASFDVVREAYLDMAITYEYVREVFMFRPYQHEPYSFDHVAVRESLEDYLLARNSSERHRQCRNPGPGSYGVAYYDAFGQYLDNVAARTNDPDVRPAHLLYEHKTMMLRRLHYMEERGHLRAPGLALAFRPVCELACRVQMAYLKMHISRNAVDKEPVKHLLRQLVQAERPVLEAALNACQ